MKLDDKQRTAITAKKGPRQINGITT